MESKAKTFTELLAAIGGAIASFFTGLPAIVWVLIAVMSIDYMTGIICGLMGKSPNTENGGVSSKTVFRGLLKKALILLVVLLAALLDKAVSMGTGAAFEAVAGATCLWFIASEGFSIIENAASMYRLFLAYSGRTDPPFLRRPHSVSAYDNDDLPCQGRTGGAI